MTTIRPFRAEDLFKFNHINLDPLTETYNIPFYMQYVATWPSLCASFEDPNGRMMGYALVLNYSFHPFFLSLLLPCYLHVIFIVYCPIFYGLTEVILTPVLDPLLSFSLHLIYYGNTRENWGPSQPLAWLVTVLCSIGWCSSYHAHNPRN